MSMSVADTIRGLIGSSGVQVFDYHEDFDQLWSALHPDSTLIGDRGAIICGINAPHRSLPDGVAWEPFERHLHALAWASCWRLRHPKSMVQMLLIGSTDWGESSPLGKLGILFETRRADALPLIGGIKWMREPDVPAIQEWLDDETTLAGDERNLFLLKDTIWQGLVNANHHGLSNVVGAFLLRYAVGTGIDEQGPATGQKALLGLLMSLLEDDHAGKWLPQDILRETRPRQWISRKMAEVPAAVLLDDMAALWAPVVRGALGFANLESRDRLTLSTPRFKEIVGGLPERLRHFHAEKKGRLTRGDIIPGDYVVEKDTEFALLLDLRFFGSEDAELEKSFFNGLVSLGEQLPRPASVTDDQWTSFQDDLKAVKSATGRGLHLHDSPPALTLLPRILTLLDPLLPIVIFSSTHRRSLLDPLWGYPNIITSFVKPVFTAGMGNWPEVVANTIRMFRDAMEQTATILAARHAVLKNARRVPSQNTSPTLYLPVGNHGHLVEVFIDESESDSHLPPPRAVCAGGIVMVRTLDAQGRPEVTDTDLWQSLRDAACLWGWCTAAPETFSRPANQPHKRGFMPKGADLNFSVNGQGIAIFEAQITAIQQALGNRGLIFPVALSAWRSTKLPDWMSAPKISCSSLEKACDLTLRNLIKDGMEGILFRHRMITNALQIEASKIAIDLAIRDYPCTQNNALVDAFGIEFRRGFRPSLRSEDGYRLTSETCARLGMAWPHTAKIIGARAVPLRDFGNNPTRPEGTLPQQLHYFADTIAHVALHDLPEATAQSQKIADFFNSGWVVDYRTSEVDQQLLEIARAWDQGDRVQAICRASRLRDAKLSGVSADMMQFLHTGTFSLQSHEIADLISRF